MPHTHVLFPSYKRVTYQIYAPKSKFYAINLKIKVNRLIMKLDGKNMCFVENFYSVIHFLSELWAFLIYIYYTLITPLKTELS